MSKIKEAIDILTLLGIPKAQQNERSALTLLALLDLREKDKWREVKQQLLRVHDILLFCKNAYSKEYAENTRETIRRQTLHQFIQAGIVILNPDDSKRSTNSPKNAYSITDEALEVIKAYDSVLWKSSLIKFIKNHGRLIDKYRGIKKKNLIEVKSEDKTIIFSPGKHNELQVKVLTDLKPRFLPKAELVYVGDAAKKMLFENKILMKKLKIPITEHDKLPDLVLFDEKHNLLFLIEAVTSHGPVSPKRQIELEETLEKCDAKRIYISAFPEIKEFKKHIDNIAWETEVWIANEPDHMIHFNGPKFLDMHYGDF